MRIIVFFDLPTVSAEDRREYRRFRKFLVKEGFIMLQESVYARLVLNGTVSESVRDKVRKNKPASGIVQMLVITEKQFSRMEFVVGSHDSKTVDNEERLIIL